MLVKNVVVIILLGFCLAGCGGGGSNALIGEQQLADEAWNVYKIDFYVIDVNGSVEAAYREGFHIGFVDAFSSDYVLRTEDERIAYEIGVADGTWNRTGDF